MPITRLGFCGPSTVNAAMADKAQSTGVGAGGIDDTANCGTLGAPVVGAVLNCGGGGN